MQRVLALIVLFLTLAATVHAQPASATRTMSGDGITVAVLKSSNDGTISGEIRRDGETFPFTALADGTGSFAGEFVAAGERYSFQLRQRPGDSNITLVTEGHEYKLTEQPSAPSKPNPLDRKPAPQAGTADAMKLHTVQFRDVTMGNVVAYTMLVPDSWNAEGRIEWSQGDQVYPQTIITVISPEKARLRFVPAMNFFYMETSPQQVAQMRQLGMQVENDGKRGTPPPQDIGAWLVSYIQESNPNVRNVRLIDLQRDQKMEEAMAKLRRDMRMTQLPAQEQMLIVTISYEEAGTTIREEITLNYSRFEPIENELMRTELWSVMISSVVAAPESSFEQVKPTIYTIANTLRPTPQWWTQSQAALAEISRNRAAANLDAIRKRAEMYDQMSKSQMDTFRQRMASQDEMQRRTINGIREVEDYQTTDGNSVKLPSHYDNVYGDGKGNYILTNHSTEPGGEFTRLQKNP